MRYGVPRIPISKKPILEKGGVPRILQEVYYTCSSDGSKEVNIELTLKRFKDKLKKLQEEQWNQVVQKQKEEISRTK